MPEKFLIYTVNGNGLGHLVETMSVAIRLRKLMPDARFLFLTSCEDPGPIWREGFASVKTLSWHPRSGGILPEAEMGRLGRAIGRHVFETYKPTVLLSDLYPRGTYGELVPYLGTAVRKIIFLRHAAQVLTIPRYLEAIKRYDRILLPFEPGTKLGIPDWIQARAQWIGPVLLRSPDAMLPREEARRRLGLPMQGRILLVTMGGGGGPQAEQCLRLVFDAAARFPRTLFAALAPPLRQYPMPPAQTDNIRVLSYFPIVECMNAFDGALSSCGLNSSAEIIHAGVPMVWLPLGEVGKDQPDNARRHVARGFGAMPRVMTVEAIAAAIARLLTPAFAAEVRQRLQAARIPNGADTAAQLILELCAASPIPSA